jgi:hypothetical protein
MNSTMGTFGEILEWLRRPISGRATRRPELLLLTQLRPAFRLRLDLLLIGMTLNRKASTNYRCPKNVTRISLPSAAILTTMGA